MKPAATSLDDYLAGDGILTRARAIATVVRATFSADPRRATAAVLLQIMVGLSGPVFAIALADLAGAVASTARHRDTMAPALVLAGSIAALMVVSVIATQVAVRLEEETGHWLERRIMTLVGGLSGTGHHENPEMLGRIERLIRYNWLTSMAVPALVACLEIIVRLLFTTVLLARVDLRLLILPLFGLPSIALAGVAERIRLGALDARRPAERRARDLFELATEEPPAKELRLFGLGPEILRRYQDESDVVAHNELSHRMRGAGLILCGRLLFAVGYLLGLAVVIQRATHGGLSVSQLVLTIGLASQIMGQLSSVSNRANWLNWSLTSVRDVVWLEDLVRDAGLDGVGAAGVGAAGVVAAGGVAAGGVAAGGVAAGGVAAGGVAAGGVAVPPPERLVGGIVLDHVSFRYPGTERDVLTDVDLTLPAGSVVAIVGDNGAGKTTLVKLLCRFYEVTSGALLVDGVDLREIDLPGWRSRVSAAFQDHARYEVAVGEAVGIGDVARLKDREAIAAAVEVAGAAGLVEALPAGLDSLLGSAWGGAELSGGQWQRLAVARSTMRNDPLLLVLDEPTAALDAEAEHALFERYAGAAGDARRQSGAITVVVSHRFSTVRMADLILVVGRGGILEQGGHEDLMALNGTYAQLFRLQARAYRS